MSFFALAKAQPQKISYASAGTDSSTRLAGELFKNLAGADMMHVPYKGTAPAISDLIGGQVQVSFTFSRRASEPTDREAKSTGSDRNQALCGRARVDNCCESGLAGYDMQQWWGIVVPSGASKEIVRKINLNVSKILESPGLRVQLAAIGAEPGGGLPEKFDALIRNEIVQWAKLIESATIVAD